MSYDNGSRKNHQKHGIQIFALLLKTTQTQGISIFTNEHISQTIFGIFQKKLPE